MVGSQSDENKNDLSYIEVIPNKLLGISPQIRGNGILFDNNNILYACGNSIVIYDLKTQTGRVKSHIKNEQNHINSFGLDCNRYEQCFIIREHIVNVRKSLVSAMHET